MSDNMVPIIIVPVIFFSIVAIVRIISDNVVRRHVIEKGLMDENVKHLFARSSSDNVPGSLKWGMVLIAVGAAILVGQFVPYAIKEEITISGMFIMGGLALILYYFIASKMMKNA